MDRRSFKIGTRRSLLALKQVDEVVNSLRKFYPEFEYKVVGIDAWGDKDKITPISEIEGTDFFTCEIEEALLNGKIDPSPSSFNKLRTSPEQSRGTLRVNGERNRTIDFAVHSAKDLPDEIPEGLIIAAITKSIDPYDALISKGNLKIDKLHIGAKIGSSSLRRKTQLKRYRRDFQIVDIRGNIEERLEKLDNDGLDAIIVAACALMRLGLQNRIAQRIPFNILKPHPLQGSLAIEVKKDNKELINLLKVLNRDRH